MASEPSINEIELARLMADQATRTEYCAHLQRRQVAMQTLMAKIQTLSDSEFEAAYGTLESLIENYNAKKLKREKREGRVQENQLGLTQNPQK